MRLRLTEEERAALRRQAGRPGVAPQTRERLEMISLADPGWSVPRIAQHGGRHPQTVRATVPGLLTGGFAGLVDRPRAGRPRRVTAAHLAALDQLLEETGRRWTMPQLVTWLQDEDGIRVHPDYLAALLKRRRFRWKRTKRPVRHKADADRQAAAALALTQLAWQAPRGPLDLWDLDQAGCAPRLPTGYTWARVGARTVGRYQAPAGRRVNPVGARAPYAPGGPRLVFETRRKEQGKDDTAAHLRFGRETVAQLPAESPAAMHTARPGVIALDHDAVHRSQAVQDATPLLAAQGRSLLLTALQPRTERHRSALATNQGPRPSRAQLHDRSGTPDRR
jgi:transposase